MRKQKDKQAGFGAKNTPAATEPAEVEKKIPQETEHQADRRQILTRLRERLRHIRHIYWMKKRLAIPSTAVALILLLAAIPFTRYTALRLFIKQDIFVTVVDSQTRTPVSKAMVVVGGQRATTNASGMVHIHANVGYQTLAISKQFYQTYTHSQLVGLSARDNHVTIELKAIGRVVPVSVINKITGKPIAGASVKALNSEATTAADGTATVVLPATAATQKVVITASGFNALNSTVQVTNRTVSANSFAITPAGKLYFLSNFSGKIDVVKTDLDGTNRQTVLAGTGNEDQRDTVLLASRDWKYLALYTQRKATGGPEIDLIDTSTDNMSNIDEGDASFTLVGWSGDRFIYLVDRNNVAANQNGREALKSFDAQTKTIDVLAQTAANPDGTYQGIVGQYLVGDKVFYGMSWYPTFYPQVTGKQAIFYSMKSDGSNKTVLKSFTLDANADYYFQVIPYAVNSLTISYYTSSGTTYYEYEDGKVSQSSDVNGQTLLNTTYPTYLLSPAGDKIFWSAYADGKNNLKVGDNNGQNAKTIASESDYSPYGWFTDNYLLVQKSDSELYIMSADGGSQPYKITNYYKPQVSYRGYGGGYGGL
ncbi:MAG TPA: hypothetical protein VHC98_02885 [Candidatus Saccharimonadales bacterium]|nr:hypothetical protein [Candidatus Saccharimonadales bacterium]